MRYFLITVKTKHSYYEILMQNDEFPSRKRIRHDVMILSGEPVDFHIMNIFEFKNELDMKNFIKEEKI
jgi:hypothetical protein